jgi:hypothetical protein
MKNSAHILVALVTLAQIQAVWAQSASNAPAPKIDADRAFYFAVESGSLTAAKEALRVAGENGKPISDLGIVYRVLDSKFFDRLNPLLDNLLKTNAVSILGEDSVFWRMNPEHIAWLDKSGHLTERFAPRYLILAAQRGDRQMVKALLQTKTGKSFTQDTKQHALYAATGARSLECVDEMLACGAKPDQGMRFISDNSQATPAVDIAARSYWISGVQRLDTNGKYKEFLADFQKEFPATTASQFVGRWDNHRDGFYASQITIEADATGMFSNYRMPFVWRTNEHAATLFLVTQKGIDREKKIQIAYDAEKKELLWVTDKGETNRYNKAKDVP